MKNNNNRNKKNKILMIS